MRGRWAAGIVPRNFAWIINGYLAVAERPGGSAPAHRRVRRHEEILWLRAQGFTKIVSLLPSTHNLHAYEELGLAYEHIPMGFQDDPTPALSELYPALLRWLYAGERVLLHQDELGERMAGVLAGFLLWSGLVPEPPLAISAVEQLLRRQLGATGRTIVTLSFEIEPPSEEDRRRPERVAVLVPLRFPSERREEAPVEELALSATAPVAPPAGGAVAEASSKTPEDGRDSAADQPQSATATRKSSPKRAAAPNKRTAR